MAAKTLVMASVHGTVIRSELAVSMRVRKVSARSPQGYKRRSVALRKAAQGPQGYLPFTRMRGNYIGGFNILKYI